MVQYFVRAAITGNWDGATTWSNTSGGAANGLTPTAAIDCVFDAASTTANITINGTSGAPSLCRSVTCTGFTGTITQGSAAQLNIGDGTAGAFLLVSGMTYIPNAAAVLKFVSTTTGNNITFGGKSPPIMTYDGVGGAWTWQDNVGTTNQALITLTNGTLNTNGKTVLCGFNSSNSNTRTLTLGATVWTVPSAPATGWDITIATGMTLSAASSTISNTSSGTTIAFAGGGLTYGTVSYTGISTGSMTLSGANTFGALTLSCASTTKLKTSGYILSANQTVTGTFTSNGNTDILRNFIYSDTVGTPRTISAATVTVTRTDFRDITGAGAGSWNLATVVGGSGDCGGNSGMTLSTPRNCYLKVNANANWSASNWFTASGGSTSITTSYSNAPAWPLPQDSAIIDANASFSISRIITMDQVRLCANNWTGAPNTPAFACNSGALELYGSMILISGMTHTGSSTVTYMGRGSSTLDGGTLTWPSSKSIIIDCATGTLTLARNLTSSALWSVISGTWAQGGFTSSWSGASTITGGIAAGTGAITLTGLTISGGSFTLGGTLTGTGAFALSGGTLDTNGFGATGYTTFTLSSTGILNLSGQMNGSGAIAISGGTVNDKSYAANVGELKGTTFTMTGGTATIKKITCSSTFAFNTAGTLTIPAGGSITWVGNWTMASTGVTLIMAGTPKWTTGSLAVGSGFIPSLEGV